MIIMHLSNRVNHTTVFYESSYTQVLIFGFCSSI